MTIHNFAIAMQGMGQDATEAELQGMTNEFDALCVRTIVFCTFLLLTACKMTASTPTATRMFGRALRVTFCKTTLTNATFGRSRYVQSGRFGEAGYGRLRKRV